MSYTDFIAVHIIDTVPIGVLALALLLLWLSTRGHRLTAHRLTHRYGLTAFQAFADLKRSGKGQGLT